MRELRYFTQEKKLQRPSSMSKRGFQSASSVTLRLFPGAKPDENSFEVVKVSGNPTSIDIDSLVDSHSHVKETAGDSNEYETFDGYFPDDGYDYSQHLKEINADRFVPVSRSLPVKQVELNPELADVMEALKSAEGSDLTEIDCSFVKKLGPLDERTRLAMLWGEDQVDEYLSMPTEKLMAINQRIQDLERSAEKRAKDREFEEFLSREFDDEKIGALSPGDVEIDSEVETDSETEEEDQVYIQGEEEADEDEEDPEKIRRDCVEETKRIVACNQSLQQSVLDQEDDMSDVMPVPVRGVPEWDCESVLSSRSNIYNHPGLICRPRRTDGKAKRLMSQPPVIEEESDLLDTPVMTVSTLRRNDESTEERRERKKAVKEFHKQQRMLRKSAKAEAIDQINKQKQLMAISKHSNYGDVPMGVPKFRV